LIAIVRLQRGYYGPTHKITDIPDHGDHNVFDAAVLQFVHHAQPELCSLGLLALQVDPSPATTPSFVRSGPVSTTSAKAASCSAGGCDDAPFERMFLQPIRAFGVEAVNPVARILLVPENQFIAILGIPFEPAIEAVGIAGSIPVALTISKVLERWKPSFRGFRF
jgi:hypothetical protein